MSRKVGTLLLIGQNQEVTFIENIHRDVLENIKEESNTKKIIVSIDGNQICYENIRYIKFYEDLNVDFGY